MEELLPICACGKCGLRVTKPGNRFINGHNFRGKLHTPEACAKMSAWQLGVPKSPKTMTEELLPFCECGKCGLRVTKKGNRFILGHHMRGISLTPEYCAAIEKQRGGNDIVNHHYIYDHSDLSKYTMKMTRSKHTYLHALMRKSGIKVPHINKIKSQNL